MSVVGVVWVGGSFKETRERKEESKKEKEKEKREKRGE